jgi:hypothetical protein
MPSLRAVNAEIPKRVDFSGHPSAVRALEKPRDGFRLGLSLNQYVMPQQRRKTEAPAFALQMRTWCDLHHKSFL